VTTLHLLKRSWLGIALCAGLVAMPFAAHADASAEVATAAQHAGFSAAATSLAAAHMHLHHTLNCLVGPKGHGFDPKQANPCEGSGNGAIPDTTDAHTKRALERVAHRTRMAIASHSLATVKSDAAKIEAALKKIG
jgi:hypothetical protein